MTWANRIVGSGEVAPESLLANPRNWRIHPRTQREALRGVLRDVGIVQEVIVNQRTGMLVDGHLRVDLALEEGQSTIPVKYVDLAEEEEAEILATIDPLSAMATTDAEKLGELLADVHSDESAVQELLAEMARREGLWAGADHLPEAPEPELDRAEELVAEWGTEAGQLWQVGEHRLLCGDATEASNLERLLAGELCELAWTDPPWNVDYGAHIPLVRRRSGGRTTAYKERSIENDNLGAAFPAFADKFCQAIAAAVLPGAPIYLAMSAQEWPVIHASLTTAGFHWSSTIIWVKDTPVLSRKDYHTRYEPLWYGWREGAARLVSLKDRSQNDVWEIDRPKRSDEHPTMKPPELVARSIKNSSRAGGRVFDPFLGSGTTMVACEQTGRVCFGLELEPKYVAVTLERMKQMGLRPRRAA